MERRTGWVVLDKPQGLPVHAGPRGGESVESRLPDWLGARCQIRQPVHRLDSDTSGCLLVATRRSALRALAGAFAARQVGKLYIAVIDAVPDKASGSIDLPLSKRSSRAQGWRMVPDPAGEAAVTDWVMLAARPEAALLALMPRTGRTHQLRVHAGQIVSGAAIQGDTVYGGAAAGRAWAGGLMLHALALSLPDPGSGERVLARTDWPERFAAAGFSCSESIESGLQPLLRSLASMASAIAAGSIE